MNSERKVGGSHHSDGVVVEDGRDVFRRKLVRGVADEETCLADRTVANDDAPKESALVSERETCGTGQAGRAHALDCRDDHGEVYVCWRSGVQRID
jgi:hypothetical protein